MILPEPQALLTPASRMPGLDGQKMSKSYNNTIGLREEPDAVAQKLRTMPTDPARVRRTDPGDPGKCPVWQLHEIYSDDARRAWVRAERSMISLDSEAKRVEVFTALDAFRFRVKIVCSGP